MTADELLLTGVARRRSQLEEQMQQVERSAAAPIAMASWAIGITSCLHQLAVAFSDHTGELQSRGGLLDQIVEQAPRLEYVVEADRIAHATIARSIDAAIERAASSGPQGPLGGLRDAVIDLLVDLARHRQREADLIYDAYDIDIGGED